MEGRNIIHTGARERERGREEEGDGQQDACMAQLV